MGKAAKTSRKGKKAWRANIKTDDFDAFVEKTTKDTLAGANNLNEIPKDSLFFIDKSTDIPIRRKIEKHREKVLYHESVLQNSAFVTAIPSSLRKSSKKKKKAQKSKSDMDVESQKTVEDEKKSDVFDLWNNNEGEANVKARKVPKSSIPAVEVDPPGCSYNPPFEAHQDALAQAVADEIQKVYRQELAPQPLPNVAHAAEIAHQTELLDISFAQEMQKVVQDDLDIPPVAHDSGTTEDKLLLEAAENNSEMDSDSDANQLSTGRKKEKRVTRVTLNRRLRHKERLKAESEAKRKKRLSKEIDSLKDIMKEIKEDDEEKQNRHLRRVVAKKERLKTCPPRLGRHKFKPAPMQVLLTEQISGSLRKLEGCPTLIRHHYKSLEKRGLVVPKAK